ncbi:MAG: penicillin acylase family protein [Verrucomicrobia bacterium]|nr:penicillin acylase family protein [Verrucomicrobiota bacterium]
MSRILLIFALMAFLENDSTAALSPLEQALSGAQASPPHPGEILWDEFGIPHIYGPDLLTVVRGFGYAQMENHAELILQNIAAARGRSAEYFGPGEKGANVESDTRVVTYGIGPRAEEWYRQGGLPQRRLIDAFVEGMNAYAAAHRDGISPVFQPVLPLVPSDVPALFQFTIHFNFMLYQSNVAQLLAGWQHSQLNAGAAVQIKVHKASNGWALAPAKSVSGHPILVGNPQLGWGVNQPLPGLGVYQWMEANLVVGDPDHPLVNAYGVAFPGSPCLGIGFNDYLGWTHTNNAIKNADLYELQRSGDGYLFDGQVHPFDVRTSEIKVRQPDGALVPQTVSVLSSVHGPVIARRDDKALALRVAGLDTNSVMSQYWEMMLARQFGEFVQANRRLQMPFFNVIYADREGHIMYLFGGRQPRRSGGTYAEFAGILPGTSSKNLWTETLRWDELPRTVDPPGGFVQNSNDPPWFATFPQTIRTKDYPGYIAPDDMYFRPQHGATFLLSRPKFTPAEIIAGKMSTTMIMAQRVVPDLITAARASGDPTAAAAAAVLQRWDRNSNADSRGALLFQQWYRLYVADPNSPKDDRWGPSYPAFRQPFAPGSPLTTPRGLKDPARAVPFLVQAAKQLQAQYGRLDAAWGDANRILLATHDPAFQKTITLTNSPGNGSDEPFGALRKVYFYPLQGSNQAFAYGGETYIQIVEFTPDGAKASAVLNYGNASRPGSPHITDQVRFFETRSLRPVYRTRAEVVMHARQREAF